jgi:hypothetical protein
MVYLTCLDREAGEYKDCQGCVCAREASGVHFPPHEMAVRIRTVR